MMRVKHKTFGEGSVTHREGNVISIVFDRDGIKRDFVIPRSFKPGFFELEGELKQEVDAAIAAEKAAKEKEQEDIAAANARRVARAQAAQPSGRKSRSSKTPAKVKSKGVIEQDFEAYLIKSNYSIETPSGSPSTVSAYIKGVSFVLEEEGLTWQSLKSCISNVIKIYDVGGAKEHLGSKSNYTIINALRRFSDFVNNVTP